MKTTNHFLTAVVALLLLTNVSVTVAQDAAPARPMYVAVTTMQSSGEGSQADWIAVEKEFMDKVTKKNEYIMSAGYYTHLYTEDSREIMYVQTYASWDAIDDATDRNNELIKEAWPNEAERDAFFKKKESFYNDFHSDEIYATMEGAKVPTAAATKDRVVYMRKRHFAFPDDGTQKEFKELNDAFVNNVIKKNELVQAYYPIVHAWGSDRRDYIEVFVYDSMGDMEKSTDRSGELIQAQWPDEKARTAMSDKMSKYFMGYHADYVYMSVHELSK